MIPLLLWACAAPVVPERPAEAPPEVSRAGSRPETHATMVDDLAAVRHPADGGGSLALVQGPTSVVAGRRAFWHLRYTAGPLGVAEGGSVVFQAPAFWGWDPPQLDQPEGPGYTVILTEADGVRLGGVALEQGMLRIGIEGRALAVGESVDLVYGAGTEGARADRFAEREAELWVGVDGDGDGIRQLVAAPVRVETTAGPPARLLVTVPSTAEPLDTVRVRVALVDAGGNRCRLDSEAEFAGGGTLELPAKIPLLGGVGAIDVVARRPGVFAIGARAGGIDGTSNPMVVREGVEPILWADLQIHTGRSDGTGTPADVYAYARDVAGLDAAAVTDHDHWGMRFLDANPSLWRESVDSADAITEPGRFVGIAGYEWTSWLHGHRHVLWFEPDPPLFSSMDPRTDDPNKLWSALKGRKALTVAHHSAGGPVSVDWRFRPPPELEPVTEIVSVHGQSESAEIPGAVHPAVVGNFVLDQLRDGLKVGFIGSTDGHDGHPGLAHLNGPSGGLAALVGAERTRESIYKALREQRVYATNGVRTILRFSVDGDAAELRVVATAAIERVEEVRRSGSRVVASGAGAVLHHQWTLDPSEPDDFVYVRVFQADGGVAWSSPIWRGGGPTP